MELWILAAGLTSLALGGVMMIIASNVIQQNHRREVARTALLSRLAFPGGALADAVVDPLSDLTGWDRLDDFPRESSVAAETLFDEREPSGARSRRTAAVASVSVAFAIIIAASWWSGTAKPGSRAATSATPPSDAVTSATTAPGTSPIPALPRVELLSLTDRATPAAFLVAGRVRNPAGSAPLRDVVAVVDVMDRAGRVLTTVRAPIKRRELNAGEDSEFSATASKASDVARYRVKFEDAARAAVPHVDRRLQAANSTRG